MTPDFSTPFASSTQLTQSLFQFWMMPMRIAQSMLETTSHLIATGSDAARTATEQASAQAAKTVERSQEATQQIAAQAEEKIAKLDDTRGDTVINPAALAS